MIILCAILAALAILAFAYITAPEGYQDSTGFHYGVQSHD